MNRRYFLLIAVLLSLLLLAYGCGDDDDGIDQSAEKLTEQGLAKFDAGDYAGASADFNAALGLDPEFYDAYLWLGWAELKLNNAGLAEDAFLTYLAEKTTSNDAKAGLALAYDAQDEYEGTIDAAEELLSSDPTWTFSRDSEANYLDVALVLAYGYYMTADFAECLQVVQDYFDPAFSVDTSTSEGQQQLADKVNSLYTG